MFAKPDTSGTAKSSATPSDKVHTPSITLPKGGGAIRGIGEKFAANPVTGTGSFSVPIYTSPGRAGFGPQLSLSYDSGAGNGPFGFGWSLSLPSITRKTDKGLPRYLDGEESDVFVLSGSEDLVPCYESGVRYEDRTTAPEYIIHRYRPRIEGLFARIERWTRKVDGDVHWRTISKDNILTLYGKDQDSRIADPANPSRVFSWLICQSYDDKGNAIIYGYQNEDSSRIFESGGGQSVTWAHERNRDGTKHDGTPRTANRYLKRIKYGNRLPNPDRTTWDAAEPTQLPDDTWMFSVVFDYGEGHYTEESPDALGQIFAQAQIDAPEQPSWPARLDRFSSYRAGFEVRTYRLCRRVLMFHHFPQELGADDYLVRSTEFSYDESPIASFIKSATQSGFVSQSNAKYLKKSLPPLEFEYSQVPNPNELAQQPLYEVDAASLENLPAGLYGSSYQWIDLDSEGIPGILTEQADVWYYKRNLSVYNKANQVQQQADVVRFGSMEIVAYKPTLSLAGGAQLLDLGGDGQVDLVQMEGPVHGFNERTADANWSPFCPFTCWPNLNTHDPNLKFVDVTGDGHTDILITEGEVITWYPSLAEEGFGPAIRVTLPLDEEKGPRVVLADGTQSIYLADLSGDGLSDLVRIRNGEICYWPNLGYGCFGAKVTMDNSPWFDSPDQFDQQRIRLADFDGSGTTDIVYLSHDGVKLYFNQSGNRWSDAVSLPQFPPIDNVVSVQVLDLLGNGTACLVWSSPLPSDIQRPMRYVNLMGDQKPHLLVRMVNNLGTETLVRYAPSTKFYLKDKEEGKHWITRLPFPVHVVEQVETYDHISRNHFITRYAYHHGYFDGEEREFRGFGMVEQWDTAEFGTLPSATNVDAASHVPPIHTKTWFHTGAYLGRNQISQQYAQEYYGAPPFADPHYNTKLAAYITTELLPDTVLPSDLMSNEEREACRALKGVMLRQEVYADDATLESPEVTIKRALTPYTVVEQNFAIHTLQHRGSNRHAVFFTHPHEAITYHYERRLIPFLNGQIVDETTGVSNTNTQWLTDPRIQHALTLEVDNYGNVLKEATIGYGRRTGKSLLQGDDKVQQEHTLITYTENLFAHDPVTYVLDTATDYRTPLPCETRTFELTGFKKENSEDLFTFEECGCFGLPTSAEEIRYEQIADNTSKQKRLIEHIRTLYRKNDLTALLPLGELESMALSGESYKLAFTPDLLTQVYRRKRDGQPDENLLPETNEIQALLGGNGPDQGGYSNQDGNWWIPSGRVFYSGKDNGTPQQERVYAERHFFLPRRYQDPFGNTSEVFYDVPAGSNKSGYDLLISQTIDPLGNTVIATNDYRVLQPTLVTDPNKNCTEVAFDALGMVVGTAVMGKSSENVGDSLDGFIADLTLEEIDDFYNEPDPHTLAPDLLKNATTRIIYDLSCFQRTQQKYPDDKTKWLPAYAATLARETHCYPESRDDPKIQISFSYSDGFGREIQKKIQAEPEKINGGSGPLRWVGSGWTVFNNKGKPVRQYEPFFSGLPPGTRHQYEFGLQVGVSPILFYDPLDRVVATLHPNHTYEKVVFDPWQQTTYDANDTVLSDPSTDNDVQGFFLEIQGNGNPPKERLPKDEYSPTWYEQRKDGALGVEEQTATTKTFAHANTPTIAHFDALGRPFLTIADNGNNQKYHMRVILDIEGNQRAVIDAKDRIVMQYDYDMLGNRIHQASMEAGKRWMLNDVTGKPIRTWDSRRFLRRMTYDELRRPTGLYVTENGAERLAERTVYGESQGDAKNHRTRVYKVFDGAGVVTNGDYDFKGNLVQNQRDLLPAPAYKLPVDWNLNPNPNDGTFTTKTEYDALNRPTRITTPDQSNYHATFNEANLLDKVEVNLKGTSPATTFVANIDYDAKGQRTRIVYGNGAETTYEYDPLTFRLIHLKTTRPAGQNRLAQIFVNATTLQDLHYTFDSVGNITCIEDKALKPVFHKGQDVKPVNHYSYDAIYRLIEAKGREHVGQMEFDFEPPNGNYRDHPFAGLNAHPNDLQSVRNYTQRYEYDEAGNFTLMHHITNGGSWKQHYDYEENSLIDETSEADQKSNRLTRTRIGNGINHDQPYTYDEHGNMVSMPHLPKMVWDFEDQLQATTQQVRNNGTAETTYYVYDASGQRVRKVTENQHGRKVKETIYLGGYEIYCEYDNSGALTLERETLHVMDDKQRIALVETKTRPNQEQPLIRYQLGNHLGSASVELTQDVALISYEEYHPHGTTAFQAYASVAEVSLKHYRYTGKERDEENGLYYHEARYYTPWLGQWINCDPMSLVDGTNLYIYSSNNPVVFKDPIGTQEVNWYELFKANVEILGGNPQDIVEKYGYVNGKFAKGYEHPLLGELYEPNNPTEPDAVRATGTQSVLQNNHVVQTSEETGKSHEKESVIEVARKYLTDGGKEPIREGQINNTGESLLRMWEAIGKKSKYGEYWCGAFAAFVFVKAGLLDPQKDRKFIGIMLGADQLIAEAKRNKWTIPFEEVRPGDLAVRPAIKEMRQGGHVTIVAEKQKNSLSRIHGNTYTSDKRKQGVYLDKIAKEKIEGQKWFFIRLPRR